MSTVEDLLSTCYLLRKQTSRQITTQLEQLRQHTSRQLATIRQQEQISNAAQRIILDQLRSHLGEDARSLLFTIELAAFVQELQIEPSNAVFCSQVQPQPQESNP